MSIKCGTFGVQAGASNVVSAGGNIGVAFTGKPDETKGYAGVSIGGGTSVGAAAGAEFGIWAVKPKDLGGESVVIALGAALGSGAEVQVVLSLKKFKFLGVVAQAKTGIEIDASYSIVSTKVF